MSYLITYEDALKICDAYKNFNFYKTEYRHENYKVVTFNYFICEYDDFANPLKDNPNIHALDMRGITFVFNEDGTLYKRFLMLPKFFNVNQVENTQLSELKKKKIENVTIKEDGSLVAFMQLPNGKVFAKTQGGFDNEQSLNAMKLYETQSGIKEFVDEALEVGFTPLFEYVSYDNRIVLQYKNRELRFIGVRDNDYGDYHSAADLYMDSKKIPFVKSLKFNSLDEIMDLMETAEDMEGVVVKFDDDILVKFKTKWYFNLHGIRTMNIFREDYIISNYLNETLDDALSTLDRDGDFDAFEFSERVIESVKNWSNHIEDSVNDLVEEYSKYDSWSNYAAANYKKPFFGLSVTKIKTPEKYKSKKIEFMLKETNKLNKAKDIVEKYKT
jgi:T4 RnlA family RNA ligase